MYYVRIIRRYISVSVRIVPSNRIIEYYAVFTILFCSAINLTSFLVTATHAKKYQFLLLFNVAGSQFHVR